MQIDSARDAVNLSKQSKQIDIEPLIDTGEIETMLQTALDDMTEKQQKIQFLNQELQNMKQETLARDRQ